MLFIFKGGDFIATTFSRDYAFSWHFLFNADVYDKSGRRVF
jgi:hypothetical protein